MAFTTVDLPCATWPIVPEGRAEGAGEIVVRRSTAAEKNRASARRRK
jgi:hypothetical protein